MGGEIEHLTEQLAEQERRIAQLEVLLFMASSRPAAAGPGGTDATVRSAQLDAGGR